MFSLIMVQFHLRIPRPFSSECASDVYDFKVISFNLVCYNHYGLCLCNLRGRTFARLCVYDVIKYYPVYPVSPDYMCSLGLFFLVLNLIVASPQETFLFSLYEEGLCFINHYFTIFWVFVRTESGVSCHLLHSQVLKYDKLLRHWGDTMMNILVYFFI